MRIGRSAFALAAAAAVALAACSTRPAPPAPSPQRPVMRPLPPAARTVSPATYVAQASSIDLFVIRASQLAQARASSPKVRAFASRMIAAHQGTASQLSFAGRRLNLLPSAALLPEHQAMLDQLRSSGAFDAAYLRQQRAIHGAAYSLHSNYAARGTSPTLRPVAVNAAAVERSHLEMLRRLP
jgi:putative membrane protein